jgi:CheY-like chemotaxis protein
MNTGTATVLVVEDEALIALDLQALLEDAGYRVMGPASSPAAALMLLDHSDPDVALLDVNLGRSDVFDVANELATRKSRVIFLTGDTMQRLPQAHRHRPLVSKPFLPHVVLQAVQDALADRSSAGENEV